MHAQFVPSTRTCDVSQQWNIAGCDYSRGRGRSRFARAPYHAVKQEAFSERMRPVNDKRAKVTLGIGVGDELHQPRIGRISFGLALVREYESRISRGESDAPSRNDRFLDQTSQRLILEPKLDAHLPPRHG